MSVYPEQLRDRVRIERATETRDDVGGVVQSWATVTTVWARYRPLRAGERDYALQQNGEQVAEFMLRSSDTTDGIGVKDRLAFLSYYWDIRSAVPYVKEGPNRWILIVAERVAP